MVARIQLTDSKNRENHIEKSKSKLITCIPRGTASFRSSHVQLHLEDPSIKVRNNPRLDYYKKKTNR